MFSHVNGFLRGRKRMEMSNPVPRYAEFDDDLAEHSRKYLGLKKMH